MDICVRLGQLKVMGIVEVELGDGNLTQGQEDYLRAQFPDLEPEQAGFVRRATSRMAKIAYENRE